jgi:hypothetical protein
MKFPTSIIVGIVTASLGLVALFLPGASGSLSNVLSVICGVLPMAILVGISRSLPPKGLGQFLCGMGLVALSMIFFAYSNFLPIALDAFFKGFNEGAGTHYDKLGIGFGDISLWIYLIPAVSIGIGVNLISGHLTAEE